MPTLDSFPKWPAALRPSTMLTPFLMPMGQRGPRTFNGRSQIVTPDAGYWVSKIGLEIIGREQLLDWRGLVTDMQGGARSFLFPIFDEQQAPFYQSLDEMPPIFHNGGVPFNGGVGYRPQVLSTDIEVALGADLARDAVTATLQIVKGGTLRRGMFFSIDGRLSMITRPPNVVGSTATVRFLPPARAAAEEGDVAEFKNPLVLMRLADPSTGKASLRDLWFGEPEIDLEESFDGLS